MKNILSSIIPAFALSMATLLLCAGCIKDLNYCYLVVESEDETKGTVSGGGIYKQGQDVPILAIPMSGFYFKAWNDGNTARSRTVKAKDVTYTAYFEKVAGGETEIDGFDEYGASYSLFSVSNIKQIRFSRGNLQYQASTGTWKFAEHQYDCVGSGNANISSSYNGWIDLFGWGTSGWSGSGATSYQPWSSSYSYSSNSYGPPSNLEGSYANADWAYFNLIVNGGNTAGLWRTLSMSEWQYLFLYRTNAAQKYGLATINDTCRGMVILPDNWTLPAGCSFSQGVGSYTKNTYSYDQWEQMQNNGAIFLPVTGYRLGTSLSFINETGHYWSTTASSTSEWALYWRFYSDEINVTDCDWLRSLGFAIRPVFCE